MHRYVKGARSERELLEIFHSNGYSVMRSAGSGVNSVSPDIIVFRQHRGMAFECKAWDRTSLAIEAEKVDVLRKWELNTGMEFYVAWRMNGKGWFFIKLSELSKADKNYTVTMKNAVSINRRVEHLLGQVPAVSP
ncbi:Holliday junction resolvase Hjc [Candidatus Marsarchaeota archaeon]|nr:Holliday junction resolvase Hjc [Candidatus Marsarchaeota archaeon]MCL5099742.1 Holliday junction resolvase Hjc [Candidatus Marsarchaeota archaeon]